MNTKDTKRTARVFVLSASLLVVAFLAYSWWASDERVIKSRLHALAEVLSIPENATEVGHVVRIAGLRRYFANEVRISVGAQEIVSREALLALVGRWIPPPGGLSVEFVDIQVTRGDDNLSAQVYLTAKLSGHDRRTGEPTIDAREANVTMAKRNGEWVMTSAATAETLTRP